MLSPRENMHKGVRICYCEGCGSLSLGPADLRNSQLGLGR